MPAHPHYSDENTPDNTKHIHTSAPPLNSAYPAESPSFRPQRTPSLTTKQYQVPFVSIYGKETRLEQVMRLKTRPVTANRDGMDALLREEKSQLIRQEPTRLQKIMALKVPKPAVTSTLHNYHPKVVPRQREKDIQKVKEKDKENVPDEKLWLCLQQCRRQSQAEDRAERQWRLEQRQRQIEFQRKKRQSQLEQVKQRRKETQFQKLVEKQVRRIERERELSERKNGGFAIYVYPEC